MIILEVVEAETRCSSLKLEVEDAVVPGTCDASIEVTATVAATGDVVSATFVVAAIGDTTLIAATGVATFVTASFSTERAGEVMTYDVVTEVTDSVFAEVEVTTESDFFGVLADVAGLAELFVRRID
jgi:hypothetical protein